MPRAIWSGAISFGLVNVPVRMYRAIEEQDLHFHLLHTKDDSRIGYEKVCKQEGTPVPDDEIGKAYEVADGEYVYLTDEDFATAEGATFRTIDISDFVPYEEIDPIYFERTSYLGPAAGAEKVYALLVRAMEKSGLAAIATYVMRDKQHLGCLRIRDGVITLERMYFADEVRPVDELGVERARVGKQELEMAAELIDRFSGSFDITKYRDRYRDALLEVVEAKRKGEAVRVEEPDEAAPPDLLEALRESLASARGGRPARGRASGRRKTNDGHNGSLPRLTKAQLVARAKRDGVKGYSSMTKKELVDVLS
jgi:DNA end-binding protein Ku